MWQGANVSDAQMRWFSRATKHIWGPVGAEVSTQASRKLAKDRRVTGRA